MSPHHAQLGEIFLHTQEDGQIRGKFQPFDRLIRGRIPTGRPFYLYADSTLTADRMQGEALVIENPLLLVEVTEPATYRQDRIAKLWAHTALTLDDV